MIISIASGKGGTGKTTIACGLAYACNKSVYIDCDVEEPNGHLLLNPTIFAEDTAFKLIPDFDFSICNYCGKCSEICEYNAIIHLTDEIYLSDDLCHSCGVCNYFCPQKAISEIKKEIGKIRQGKTSEGILFFDAILRIGEAAAAPLIKQLKSKVFNSNALMKEIASIPNSTDAFVFIDSPPGTSCSMVETVKDSDYCILVTESTPFGLNDLKLAVNVLKQIGIKFGVVINKYDNEFVELEEYLNNEKLTLLEKIPFNFDIARKYSNGSLPAKEDKDYFSTMINIFNQVQSELNFTSEKI